MLPPTITTAELQELTKYSRPAIVELEQQNVIKRVDRDTWPMPATMAALVVHLRDRVRKTAVSDERSRWEAARAVREELKAQQLAGTLCKTTDFNDAWLMVIGAVVSRLIALPARVTRDLALRKAIEREIDALRTEVADEAERWANELGGKGKAA